MMDHPRLGRRLAGTSAFVLVMLIISIGAIWPSAATAASIVGNFFAEASFSVVYVQTQELYPTTIRNTALGLCLASSRIGTFASSLVPVLAGSTGTLMLIALLCALAAPLAFLTIPETLGKGLS